MKFVFVLLVPIIHQSLSMGCKKNTVTETVTATYTVSYAPPVVTITPTCPPLAVAPTCSPSVATITPSCSTTHTVSYAPPAPSCSTTTAVITEHLSITPTNCLQSTHTKEMSTTTCNCSQVKENTDTVTGSQGPTNCLQSTYTKEMSTTVYIGTGNTDAATGGAACNCSEVTATTMSAAVEDQNSSPVILGAFIAVLAALLVAVTTGWIVTCVVNRRKEKALTKSKNKDNYALQNPLYDSEYVQHYQGNPPPHTQTGYSSQGPAYEQVRVNMATDYDVIDRSGPRPPTTHPDQDYSTLDTDEQEHDYHVLESTNAGGPTAVGGQEPQDYEIPLRKM